MRREAALFISSEADLPTATAQRPLLRGKFHTGWDARGTPVSGTFRAGQENKGDSKRTIATTKSRPPSGLWVRLFLTWTHRQRTVISRLEACVVYSFSIVVITNYQELGGPNNTNVLSEGSMGATIQVSTASVPFWRFWGGPVSLPIWVFGRIEFLAVVGLRCPIPWWLSLRAVLEVTHTP